MTPLFDAVYARLVGSAALTSLLATYTDGAGVTTPAIFMESPVPRNARRPWVVALGTIAADTFDTKDRDGMDLEVDFLAAADQTGDARSIDAIAELVRARLHRYYLDLTAIGFQVLIAKARPPMVAPTDETVVARLIQLRWILRALT